MVARPSVTPTQGMAAIADNATIIPLDLASSLAAPCGDEPWMPTRGMAQDLQPRDVDPKSGKWLLTSESGGVYLFEPDTEGRPGRWLSRFCPGEGLPTGKIVDAVFGPGKGQVAVAMASRGLATIDLITGRAAPVASLPEVTVARCLRVPDRPGQVLLVFAPVGPVGDFGGLAWFGDQGVVSAPRLTIPGSPGVYAYRIVDAVWLASTDTLFLASTAGLFQLEPNGNTQQRSRDQVAALDLAPDGSHFLAAGGEVVKLVPPDKVTKMSPAPGPPKHRPAIRDIVVLDDGYVTANTNGTLTRAWTEGTKTLREQTVHTLDDARTLMRVGSSGSVVVGTWKNGLYHVVWPPSQPRPGRP